MLSACDIYSVPKPFYSKNSICIHNTDTRDNCEQIHSLKQHNSPIHKNHHIVKQTSIMDEFRELYRKCYKF